MANSNQTKYTIKMEIRKFSERKRQLEKQLKELKIKKDRFSARIDSIDIAISKLEADLNG